MADFIEMDHAAMLRQIAELDKTLANPEKSVSGEIMDTVLHEAAEQLKDEQAHILSGAPSDGYSLSLISALHGSLSAMP